MLHQRPGPCLWSLNSMIRNSWTVWIRRHLPVIFKSEFGFCSGANSCGGDFIQHFFGSRWIQRSETGSAEWLEPLWWRLRQGQICASPRSMSMESKFHDQKLMNSLNSPSSPCDFQIWVRLLLRCQLLWRWLYPAFFGSRWIQRSETGSAEWLEPLWWRLRQGQICASPIKMSKSSTSFFLILRCSRKKVSLLEIRRFWWVEY